MRILKLDRWIKNKTACEWIEAILFAAIVAFTIRTWLYAPFRVPTGSMVPTIYVGDLLLADMNAYGYKIPFSEKTIFGDEIKRGDIVIFPNPDNPKECYSSLYYTWSTISSLLIGLVNSNYVPRCIDYIKRVVAIGGDKIEFVGEKVYINRKLEEGYKPYLDGALPSKNIYYSEIVPSDSVFVMGDNRRNSHDGRFWHINGARLSYVDKDRVRAKGKWIYFSKDPYKGIFNGGIRWSRIFTSIK